MKKGIKRIVACALTAALALSSVLTPAIVAPTRAIAGEAEVRAVGEGVFKFNMGMDFVLTDDDDKPIRDEAGNELGVEMYGRGSAFLINEDTVLTCYHNASFSDDFFATLRELGYREQEVLDSMKYSVTVSRDVEIPATLVNWSKSEDWAIFKLDQKVGGSRPLTLRNSSTVQAAETVWSVGFPADSDVFVINTYRPDDVTIKSGTVNKAEDTMMITAPDAFGGLYYFSGQFLQTSVAMSGGDSGGPMVDNDGYVVGINESGADGYYYGVAIDEITVVLDRLNITYNTTTPEPTPPDPDPFTPPALETYTVNTTALDSAISNAEGKSADAYTAESYAALTSALSAAKDAKAAIESEYADQDAADAAQATVDTAAENLNAAVSGLAEKPKGPSTAVIGAIAAVAVAAIAAIAFVLTRKKKPAAAPAPAPAPAPTAVTPEQPKVAAPAKAAPLPAADVEPGTTVLTDDEPATTILTEDVDGGVLTRMSTNEKIVIDRSELSLGRERSAVDYCLEGNGNISRVHARILVRDDQVFIVDNNTPNGTFVNNAKLRPGQEQQLKSGDIIRLADEKFRYNK